MGGASGGFARQFSTLPYATRSEHSERPKVESCTVCRIPRRATVTSEAGQAPQAASAHGFGGKSTERRAERVRADGGIITTLRSAATRPRAAAGRSRCAAACKPGTPPKRISLRRGSTELSRQRASVHSHCPPSVLVGHRHADFTPQVPPRPH